LTVQKFAPTVPAGIFTRKGTEKQLANIEKKISEYMNEFEKNDIAETDEMRIDSSKVAEILKY
jgi:hypothetical protein